MIKYPLSILYNRGRARGKSVHHRARCWLTASEGDFKDSATEIYRLFIGKGGKVR